MKNQTVTLATKCDVQQDASGTYFCHKHGICAIDGGLNEGDIPRVYCLNVPKTSTADKIAKACNRIESKVSQFIKEEAFIAGMETYSEQSIYGDKETANYEGMCTRYRVLRRELRSIIHHYAGMDTATW